MNLLILGPLEARVEGVLVPLGGAKPRAMLATLLLHPNEVVSVDRLTGALWGDQPPPSAAANIKTYASQLRKALDGGLADSRLLTRPPGYLFRVEPRELDLLAFGELAATGRSALACGDFRLAAQRLDEALSLWRGDVCADTALGWELDMARTRLDEHRLAVTEDWLEARLRCGEHRELVPELRALVAANPLRERLWEYLMAALGSAGRQADALAAYAACRTAFVRELGLEPGIKLRNMQAAILAGESSGPDLPPAAVLTGGPAVGEAGEPDPGPQDPVAPTPDNPVPQRNSPLRSRLWRVRHSLWLLPALLGFGLCTWLSFLYIGLRARHRKWLLISAGHAFLSTIAFVLVGITNSQSVTVLAGTLLLILWGGGSIQALVVNRSWLRWRSDRTPWYLT